MFSIPFEVCESIVIDGSLTEVFSKVSNFSEWKHWSPWLCQNANASVSITGEKSEIGHQQVWDGEWIGSGEMKISYIHPSQFIDYDLVFLKPWKSKAQARFEFLKTDQGIKVSWKLQSKLPIFLFFLKKMMIALIASDYTRGLVMLKQFVEKGEIAAETKMLGTQELPAFHFVGQRQACTIKEIGSSMESNFAVLHKFVQESLYPKPDFYLSIYHQFDLVKGVCDYTAAMGYYEQKPTQDYLKESGEYPIHKAVHVNQKGEYLFLGNAWAAAMSFQRYKKLKLNTSAIMYEKYISIPPQSKEKEISTDICIPVI